MRVIEEARYLLPKDVPQQKGCSVYSKSIALNSQFKPYAAGG